MPLFHLKNAKKKLTTPSLSSLGLRKTQSTGNIDDSILSEGKCHLIVNKPKETKSILKAPGSTTATTATTGNDYSQKPPTPPPQLPSVPEDNDDDEEKELLASKLKDITACDMELLLSMETQARMDVQEVKDNKKKEKSSKAAVTQGRPSKVKFELPVTPPRSRSPDLPAPTTSSSKSYLRKHRWSLPEESIRSELNECNKKKQQQQQQQQKRRSNRLSRWGRIIVGQENTSEDDGASDKSTDSDSSLKQQYREEKVNKDQSNNNHNKEMMVGTKVKLIQRALPTMGIIKYIGPVTMYGVTSEWVGIELESRVGNTDGSIEGHQYFLTDPQRGVFVKKEDLAIV